MKDKRKAYEEKIDAQLEEWNAQIALLKARADKAKAEAKIEYNETIETLQRRRDEAKAKLHELKTAGDEAWDEVKTAFRFASSKFKGKAAGHAANGHARRLAEAIILQSIEDLWNPVCKKGSLMFFQGDGFALCSEIAGISYIKQLAMLRMLAYAGPKQVYAA